VHVEVEQACRAPAATVWRLLADLPQWPTWTDSMTAVTLLEPGQLHVGTRARVEQPGLRPLVWTVTDLETDRRFCWQAKMPGMRLVADHLIVPGKQIRLTLDVSGPLTFLARRAYGARIEEYVHMEARGLAAAAEHAAKA